MATEEEHAAAVLAFLTARDAAPYDVDDLPASRPPFYTEVMVVRRFGGEQRSDGSRDGELYRILLRQVARTVTNARTLRTRAAPIEGAVLTVGGLTTTPIEFETADVIGPDDGWFSGVQQWTYALI